MYLVDLIEFFFNYTYAMQYSTVRI